MKRDMKSQWRDVSPAFLLALGIVNVIYFELVSSIKIHRFSSQVNDILVLSLFVVGEVVLFSVAIRLYDRRKK